MPAPGARPHPAPAPAPRLAARAETAPAGPAGLTTGATGAELSSGDFSALVAAVTSAFGDPTRRQVYLMARERPAGVTASEVAKHFSLHPNVARHHLDKLVAAGYLEVARTRVQSTGAGRPSKRYLAGWRPAVSEPGQLGSELLLALLGGALAMLPANEAEEMAESVGYSYGCKLAGPISSEQRSLRSALRTVAEALTAHGFSANAEHRGPGLALVSHSCPFFETAVQHPVVCALERGVVKGMLNTLYHRPAGLAQWSSRAKGDDACVACLPEAQ